jgi:predicted nucleotidyltransferase
MQDEGTVSKTNIFENENPQSTIRSPHQEETTDRPYNLKAYSRSRVAYKSKPINVHMSNSELDAQTNETFIQYMRSKGIHDSQTCKHKMRRPKGFVNLIERNDFARIIEKNFKEQEARENRYREQIQVTHKSVFVGSVNRSSDHDKSAFERLYELAKSMQKNSSMNNHQNKTELKPLRKVPKRKKTFMKFDSYCAREQHKIQANFLQHISWEIINKMNSQDLAAQINGKLMADKVKIKGVGKNSKENPLSTEINAFDNPSNEKLTQVKIKKILNYGKLPKNK